MVVAGSLAISGDAAEIFVEPKAPKDVASVAFVAPEAMKTTVATNARAATGTAAKTVSAPANQDLEAKTALTAANAQAALSELSEILTTEASTSSPAAAKPAEFKAAEALVRGDADHGAASLVASTAVLMQRAEQRRHKAGHKVAVTSPRKAHNDE